MRPSGWATKVSPAHLSRSTNFVPVPGRKGMEKGGTVARNLLELLLTGGGNRTLIQDSKTLIP
jgi:hypothetical protein